MMRYLWGATPRFPFQPDGYWPGAGPAPYSTRQVGLLAFTGVVVSLFGLFTAAYLMRISYEDWRVLPPVPWQLWLSTGLLVASDAVWVLAVRAARRRERVPALRLAGAGWLLALTFVASQLGAWQAMVAQQVGITAGPAAGFFYMLTGLHGLHVIGGVVAAGWVLAKGLAQGGADAGVLHLGDGLALCARYWHLLLGLWLALFALLFWMTPEMVRAICASVGIPVR